MQVLGSQPRVVEMEGGLERHAYPPPVEGEFERAMNSQPPPAEGDDQRASHLLTSPVLKFERVPGALLSSMNCVRGGKERPSLSQQRRNLGDNAVIEETDGEKTEKPKSQAPRQTKERDILEMRKEARWREYRHVGRIRKESKQMSPTRPHGWNCR